jgi:MFS family permease
MIHVATGFATSGINISLGNIGLKLAPREEAIVYIVARNMTLAAFAALAPIAGGILADYFANRTLLYELQIHDFRLPLVNLKQWGFLFIIGAFLGLLSLRLLRFVDEDGEVQKDVVMPLIRRDLSGSFIVNTMKMLLFKPALLYPYLRKKIRQIM